MGLKSGIGQLITLSMDNFTAPCERNPEVWYPTGQYAESTSGPETNENFEETILFKITTLKSGQAEFDSKTLGAFSVASNCKKSL